MKKYIKLLFSLLILSCSESDGNDINPSQNYGNTGGNNNTWLIPKEDVKDGGPGKDGIPSVNNPKFITANQATYLQDEDLIIGVYFKGDPIAYPHIVLDWHEVVNHGSLTVSYCPLTGTAYGWESKAGGNTTTFGVSGLLYNSNLIMYDRSTDSYWSQMRLECVNGELIGEKPALIDVVETDWKTWRELYPNTEVLSLDTGFNRSYGDYPYGNYKTNHDWFIFSASPTSDALPNKDRVYALTDENQSKVFQFSQFVNGKAVKTNFKNKDYLVVGNSNLIYGFELSDTLKDLDFEYDLNGEEGVFFKDNEGNKWSIFGEAISGNRKGQKLKGAKSVVSFWFAIAAFYPSFELYESS